MKKQDGSSSILVRQREPIFPSQETKMLTFTFGTGRKTAEEREELIRNLAASAEHAQQIKKDPTAFRPVPKLKGGEVRESQNEDRASPSSSAPRARPLLRSTKMLWLLRNCRNSSCNVKKAQQRQKDRWRSAFRVAGKHSG